MDFLTKRRKYYKAKCQSLREYYKAQSQSQNEHRSVFQYGILVLVFLLTACSFSSCLIAFRELGSRQDTLRDALHSLLIDRVRTLLPDEKIAREKQIDAGLRELSLAPSRPVLDTRIAVWRTDEGVIAAAKSVMKTDDQFIFPYTLFFVFLTIFAMALASLWTSRTQRSRWKRIPPGELVFLGTIMIAITLLALTDTRENCYLETLLAGSFDPGDLSTMRFYSQSKFCLLGGASLALLLMLGIGLRREFYFWTRGTSTTVPPPENFQWLVAAEQARILKSRGNNGGPDFQVTFEAAEEPRVSECKIDFVGLALSGGGIRSATFNLGLLQGLHRFDLLRHIDYLATVSGGGYIGGFWSRWLKETEPDRERKGRFPDEYKQSRRNFSGDSRVFEAQEIRHIREFSNFLFPRVGIFDTETWGGAVALIANILPALVTSLCVLGLSLIFWLVLTFYMACPDIPEPWTGLSRAAFLSGVTALVLWVMECWWRSAPTGDRNKIKNRSVVIGSFIAFALTACLAWIGQDDWLAWLGLEPRRVWIYSPTFDVWFFSNVKSSYENWWTILGIVNASAISKEGWIWIPRLYEPSITWILVSAGFLLFRFKGVLTPSSMTHRVMLPTDDRVAMRLLGMASSWAVFATFWHIGLNLKSLTSIYVVGGGAAGSAGLFALLRNWIGEKLARQHEAGLWEKLKPYAPQVLAYLAIGLAWAVIASNLIRTNGNDWYGWYRMTLAMIVPILLVLLVDPHEFSLHAVYRDRICRAYIGAALQRAKTAAQNRQTDFRRGDDVYLSSLLPVLYS
jgi:hypothetical protein